MSILFFYATIILAALVATTTVKSAGIPYKQYKALKDLYDDTNGKSWTWTSAVQKWNMTLPATGWNNPCDAASGGQTWQGVLCTCDSLKACNVTSVKLDSFGLDGELPTSLGDLDQLTYLTLSYSTKLKGSIPSSLCNLKKIKYLLLRSNTLSGTVPPCLHNLSTIVELRYNDNQISGTLPEFGYMPKLYKFSVRNNWLTGPIPASLTKTCQSLYGIYIFNNVFNSSFPPELANCRYMRDIQAANCSVHGNISFASSLHYLNILNVNGNKLSGSLPPLTNHSFLYQLSLYDNYFTGEVPESYGSLKAVKYFWLYNNSLSGTFPAISEATKLEQILIQHNQFTGPTDFLNISGYAPLKNVDIGNNQFSGTLDLDTIWTRYSSLQSFAANTNCLRATITELLCKATSLQNLILDGLHAADACPDRITLGLSFLDDSTYYLSQPSLDGDIPACLFNLSQIQRIHMSGNDYKSSLPSNLAISSTLTDLVLSNNLLYGDIPSSLLAHRWDVIDLSFNKLSGTLPSSITVTSNTTIYLDQNRLSGEVPASLGTVSRLRILDGNLFDCGLSGGHTSLPKYDPVFDTYSCSSNAVYISLLTWTILLLGLALVIIPLLLLRRHDNISLALAACSQLFNDTVDDIKASYSVLSTQLTSSVSDDSESVSWADMNANLLQFKVVMGKLRWISIFITAVTIVIYMPIYAGLSSVYSSHAKTYLWTISMAYMSGLAPAIILTILISLTIFALIYAARDITLHDRDRVTYVHGYFKGAGTFALAILAILTINLIVIVTINVYFVRLQDTGNETQIVIADVAMAGFKVVWTNVIVRYATNRLAYYHLCQLESEWLIVGKDGVSERDFTAVLPDSYKAIIEESGVSNKGDVDKSHAPPESKSAAPGSSLRSAGSFIETRPSTHLTGSVVPIGELENAWSSANVAKFYDKQSYGNVGQSIGLIEVADFDAEHIFRSNDDTKLVIIVRKLYTKFLVFIGVLNNIVIPLVVFLFASKSCFYNSIYQKSSIESSYTYLYCCYCRLTTCTDIADGYKTIYTAYKPQFTYSYQCSTAFLRAYSNVFVYKAAQMAFLLPVLTILFNGLRNHYNKYKSNASKVSAMQSSFINALSYIADIIFFDKDGGLTSRREISTRARENLIPDLIILKICNIFTGLLTFGMVCPPIAVCLVAAVWSQSYTAELNIGARVRKLVATKRLDLVESFNEEYVGFFLVLYECIEILVPVAVLFIAFFIFDMAGDVVGPTQASPFVVVLFILSFGVYFPPYAESVIIWFKNRSNYVSKMADESVLELASSNSNSTAVSLEPSTEEQQQQHSGAQQPQQSNEQSLSPERVVAPLSTSSRRIVKSAAPLSTSSRRIVKRV